MEKIGKYEILDKIGRGGFGVVYKGRDPYIQRLVAIKTCATENKEIRERFFREARIAGNLHHPNVVTIHDFGVEDELPYLVQEFIEGEDLDKKIKAGQALTFEQKLDYLIQIAEGLDYAHSRGVVHRDVKPSNIRVASSGTVKVMDFGIAKLSDVESRLTQTGMTLGTVTYLSPEQLQGTNVDHRSDIFSYGVLAYELLAYRRPFGGDTVSRVFYEILHADPPPLTELVPNCPPRLEAAVRRCLEKDVNRRYPKISLVVSDLGLVREQLDDATLKMTTTAIIPSQYIDAVVPDSSGSASDAALKSLRRLAERAAKAVEAGDLSAAELNIQLAKKEHSDAAAFREIFGPLLERVAELRRRREQEIRHTEEAALRFEEARHRFEAEQYAQAQTALVRCLELEPSHREALALQQEIEAALERQRQAGQRAAALEQARTEIEARLAGEELGAARAALDAALRVFPKETQTFASLGQRLELLERAGRIERAAAEAERLALAGQLEQACDLLRRAQALEGESERLRTALQDCEAVLEQRHQAQEIAQAERRARVQELIGKARAAAVYAKASAEYEAGCALLREALELEPGEASAEKLLRELESALVQRQKAERQTQVLEQAETTILGHLAGGELGKAEKALARARREHGNVETVQRLAVEIEHQLKRSRLEELLARSRALLEAQDFEAACAELGRVLELEPDHAVARPLLASARSGLDRQHAEQVRREQLTQLASQAQRAAVAGSHERARDLWREALALDPGRADLAEGLARAEAAQAARVEHERQAQQQRDRQLAAALARVESLLGAGKHKAAARAVARAERQLGAKEALSRLRQRIDKGEKAKAADRAKQRADERTRGGAASRRQALPRWLAAGAAALAVGVLAAFWLGRESSAPAGTAAAPAELAQPIPSGATDRDQAVPAGALVVRAPIERAPLETEVVSPTEHELAAAAAPSPSPPQAPASDPEQAEPPARSSPERRPPAAEPEPSSSLPLGQAAASGDRERASQESSSQRRETLLPGAAPAENAAASEPPVAERAAARRPADAPVASPGPARQPAVSEPSRPRTVPPAPDPREAILAALRQYEAAYERLDEQAVARIFTGSDVGELRSAFRNYKSFTMDIDYAGCQVSPNGERATATCSVERVMDPRAGAEQRHSARQTFYLRSSDGKGWVIERVE